MNTEKELALLKEEQKRLLILLLIPGTILFAFVMLSSSPTVEKLIAPLSVGAAMLILCVIDFAIVIPIAIKLDRIKKQIMKITDDNPQ